MITTQEQLPQKQSEVPTVSEAHVQALEKAADSLHVIASFINGGGLQKVLSGYARAQSVTALLGGLTSHSGRNGLDARTLDQNALEIATQVEKVFAKYQEILDAKAKGEERDNEMHDAEKDFAKWMMKKQEE